MARLKYFNLNSNLTCDTHCTCRPEHNQFREHNRVTLPSQTQTSAISEHANYTRSDIICFWTRLSSLIETFTGTVIRFKRLLKFTYIVRLHPKYINSDSRIGTPLSVAAYMVRNHLHCCPWQPTGTTMNYFKGTVSSSNNAECIRLKLTSH